MNPSDLIDMARPRRRSKGSEQTSGHREDQRSEKGKRPSHGRDPGIHLRFKATDIRLRGDAFAERDAQRVRKRLGVRVIDSGRLEAARVGEGVEHGIHVTIHTRP